MQAQETFKIVAVHVCGMRETLHSGYADKHAAIRDANAIWARDYEHRTSPYMSHSSGVTMLVVRREEG